MKHVAFNSVKFLSGQTVKIIFCLLMDKFAGSEKKRLSLCAVEGCCAGISERPNQRSEIDVVGLDHF